MTRDTKTKVYHEVLEKIREYIVINQLQDGDRLPSERELSEQLDAGRSSIREALRAIELLGLIETRHGEGTFLRSYQPYYSVEILSTFILQDTWSQKEVMELKYVLEKQVLASVAGHLSESHYEKLITQLDNHPKDVHTYIFSELFELGGNRLLTKVWFLLEGFIEPISINEQPLDFYKNLLHQVKENQTGEAIETTLRQIYHLD